MPETSWLGKPYYSLDAWCKENLHHKCYKVALNAHMTCPNRDGSLDTRGCIFCSAGGSGDFAVDTAGVDMEVQLAEGIRRIKAKLPQKKSSSSQIFVSEAPSVAADFQSTELPCIIAYFQAYTNTYAPVPYLEKVFTSALENRFVCGISIATRPDCLPEEVLLLLSGLKQRFPEKFVWIELGLQTIHEKTANFIRRGYALSCFEAACSRLKALKIPVIVHLILGLPGETKMDMLASIRYLNALQPFGIKLQLLHILKGTDLEKHFVNGEFDALTKEEYLDILITCLENLSPDIVIHRVTGDGPKKLLIAPLWSADKRDVLNSLHRLMKERNSSQGRKFDSEFPT